MSTEIDYPVEREQQAKEEGTRSTYTPDLRVFRPRPTKGKTSFDNKVLFGVFSLNQFKWFREWPTIRNYYVKLAVHSINVMNDAGYPRRQLVICEPGMNKYASELSDASRAVPAPFPGVTSCDFCRKSGELWNDYRDKKKAAGIDGVTLEKFKELMKQHPEIDAVRDLAREWGAQDKYYFLVFDYSKWLGEVTREENESGEMGWQAWIGAQKILDGLYAEQKLKNYFWDFGNGKGRAIVITRDNKKGPQFCTYTVRSEHTPPQLDGETSNYILNPPLEDIHDPAEFVLELSTIEKKAYVAAYGHGSPTPRDDSQRDSDTAETSQPEKDSVEVPSTAAASSRPRPRLVAPVPTPAVAPTATFAAPAEQPSATPVSDSPPIPAADAPKRSKVTWRK